MNILQISFHTAPFSSIGKFDSGGLNVYVQQVSHHLSRNHNLTIVTAEKAENFKLDIIGLMCLPPVNEDPEKYFSELQQLASSLSLEKLSMGMSNDYLKAAKYGSSFLRIGSNIFGSRN